MQERRIGVDAILSSYVKKLSLIIISNKECFTKGINNIVERNHQKGGNNNFYGGTSEKIPSAQNPISSRILLRLCRSMHGTPQEH